MVRLFRWSDRPWCQWICAFLVHRHVSNVLQYAALTELKTGSLTQWKPMISEPLPWLIQIQTVFAHSGSAIEHKFMFTSWSHAYSSCIISEWCDRPTLRDRGIARKDRLHEKQGLIKSERRTESIWGERRAELRSRTWGGLWHTRQSFPNQAPKKSCAHWHVCF